MDYINNKEIFFEDTQTKTQIVRPLDKENNSPISYGSDLSVVKSDENSQYYKTHKLKKRTLVYKFKDVN